MPIKISAMTEDQVEAALDANGMNDMREWRKLMARRSFLFEKRLAARERFEKLVDTFYAEMEARCNGTLDRADSEDEICEIVWLAEQYGFDKPSDI